MTRTLEEIWPPYGLVVRAGELTMTALRESDVPEVVALVEAGIHDPDAMPFSFPWTRAPAEEIPGNYMRFFGRTLAGTGDGNAALELVVRRGGEIVGLQALNGQDVRTTRRLESGSWLGRRFQGQGIGLAMRQAICAVAFDHLGLDAVTSGAWADNPRSLRISERVGYRVTAREQWDREGEPCEMVLVELLPEHFVPGPDPVEVEGAEPLRRFLGLTD